MKSRISVKPNRASGVWALCYSLIILMIRAKSLTAYQSLHESSAVIGMVAVIVGLIILGIACRPNVVWWRVGHILLGGSFVLEGVSRAWVSSPYGDWGLRISGLIFNLVGCLAILKFTAGAGSYRDQRQMK